jgi:excinuclease ABC subunit C
MDADAVREAAGDLPSDPGVYQFLDGERVVYVGKAVDLRDRVRSYTDPRSRRIGRMVRRATGIDFAVTDTETQALLLEANLIKRHQPRYNVRLKDDKSYPLVQFTDHPVPRIEITRDPDPGATAFGPFTDKGQVETVVKALRETYGIRGCSDHKYRGRERPCLDYDVGLCSAPCTGEISEADYAADVEATTRFFEGETGVLTDPLGREMERAAQEQAFERAANLRDRLAVVESFHGEGGAAVADAADGDEEGGPAVTDVLGVALAGDRATVARLHAEGGQLVDRERHPVAAPDPADGAESGGCEGGADGAVDADGMAEATGGTSTVAEVLAAFVPQFYADRELPDRLLLPEDPGDEDLAAWLAHRGVTVEVPGTGREATLVDLALKNAARSGGRADELGALADALGIDRPERIEGFDVSHAGGTAAVGSDVCFVDGSPRKSDYRRRKLSERNDDYDNMRRLVGWRVGRRDRDDRPDPDLLLIDGGAGQLAAAREALAEAGWTVPVIALAKEEEVVHAPERTHDWPDDAPHLHLLQRVRDEAHRFAVRYHQTVRDDISTVLDDLPGVGPALRTRLLARFGSVEGIRAASREELTAVDGVGEATADTLLGRL